MPKSHATETETGRAPAFYRPTASDSPVERLSASLHHLDVAHRQLRIRFAQQLGLSGNEFNAVTKVAGAGSITPKLLAESLGLTTGAVTAIVDRLEVAGLLQRQRNPRDRRSVLVVLTPAAEKQLDQVFDAYYKAVATTLSTAPDLDVDMFTANLEHTALVIHTMATDIEGIG